MSHRSPLFAWNRCNGLAILGKVLNGNRQLAVKVLLADAGSLTEEVLDVRLKSIGIIPLQALQGIGGGLAVCNQRFG